MNPLQKARLEYLRRLIDDRYKGNVAAFGRAMGYKSERFADRYLHPERDDGRRIGDKAARDIERVHWLPAGAMDEHTAPDAPVVLHLEGNRLYAMESQLVGIFRAMGPDGRDALMGAAQRIYLREHPEGGIANPFPAKPMPTDPAPNPRAPKHR